MESFSFHEVWKKILLTVFCALLNLVTTCDHCPFFPLDFEFLFGPFPWQLSKLCTRLVSVLDQQSRNHKMGTHLSPLNLNIFTFDQGCRVIVRS